MIWTIEAIKEHAEMVAGLWDGNNPGVLEEASAHARDVLFHLERVVESLEEIKNFDESDVMKR